MDTIESWETKWQVVDPTLWLKLLAYLPPTEWFMKETETFICYSLLLAHQEVKRVVEIQKKNKWPVQV